MCFFLFSETVVEKEVEKTETPEAEESPVEATEKNGDAAAEETTAENGTEENGTEDKCALKNGNVKQNGFSDKEAESTESVGM